MPNLQVVNFLEKLTSDDSSTDYPGRMDTLKLPQWPLDEANVYLCGPVEFMQAQWRSLIEMGVPPTRLHREVFGPELLNYLR